MTRRMYLVRATDRRDLTVSSAMGDLDSQSASRDVCCIPHPHGDTHCEIRAHHASRRGCVADAPAVIEKRRVHTLLLWFRSGNRASPTHERLTISSAFRRDQKHILRYLCAPYKRCRHCTQFSLWNIPCHPGERRTQSGKNR